MLCAASVLQICPSSAVEFSGPEGKASIPLTVLSRLLLPLITEVVSEHGKMIRYLAGSDQNGSRKRLHLSPSGPNAIKCQESREGPLALLLWPRRTCNICRISMLIKNVFRCELLGIKNWLTMNSCVFTLWLRINAWNIFKLEFSSAWSF